MIRLRTLGALQLYDSEGRDIAALLAQPSGVPTISTVTHTMRLDRRRNMGAPLGILSAVRPRTDTAPRVAPAGARSQQPAHRTPRSRSPRNLRGLPS